jgi:flagellar M-ring protein FliF
MGDQLRKVRDNIRDYWNTLSRRRKITAVGLFLGIVIIAIVTVALLNRTSYVKLYEGLDAATAADVVTTITELGYESNMSSNGTVYVVAGNEDTIAMQLAQQDIPQTTIPYDDYVNNIDMFTTESEKAQYLRIAMENRMSKIISTLEGVDTAIVTLTIPENQNTVITTLRQYPTASVTVYLEPDLNRLSDRQIEGIKNIVSAAASGLTPENISIQDGAGIPQVSAGDSDGTSMELLTERFAYKTRYENDIKKKIENLLTPVYGPDGFAATVNMVLNFDAKQEEETNYSAEPGSDNTGVLQYDDSTAATGGTVAEGGVAGEEVNTEEYPEGQNAGTTDGWSETSRSSTWLVDTYRSQIIKDGYTIDGLSIAVIIYRDYLSEAQKEELVRIIANSGTIAPEVAAQVVSVANFQKLEDVISEPEAEEPAIFLGLTMNDLILIGAILAIILIVLTMAMVLRGVTFNKRRKQFEQKVIASGQFAFEEGDNTEIEKTLFNLHRDTPDMEIPSLIDDGVETKEVIIRKEIANFAKHSPEIVAQLLRNWMKEAEEEA